MSGKRPGRYTCEFCGENWCTQSLADRCSCLLDDDLDYLDDEEPLDSEL